MNRRQFKQWGKRLQITRAALNLTEQQAADGHGITLKTYRRWEAGEIGRCCTGPTLRFAQRYNLSLDWLIEGDTSRLDSRFTAGNVAILRRLSRRVASNDYTGGAA